MKAIRGLAFIGLGVLASLGRTAMAETPYEVWSIDQSNSFGKAYGGTLYIHDGKDLEGATGQAPPYPR